MVEISVFLFSFTSVNQINYAWKQVATNYGLLSSHSE